jgi:hypothetical protein
LDEARKANFKKLLPPQAQVFASGTTLPVEDEQDYWETFHAKAGTFSKT